MEQSAPFSSFINQGARGRKCEGPCQNPSDSPNSSLTIVREDNYIWLYDKSDVWLGRHVGLDRWLRPLHLGDIPSVPMVELRLQLLDRRREHVPRVAQE